MKKLIILLQFILFINLSCTIIYESTEYQRPPPHAKAYGLREQYVYYYYPDYEIYYYPVSRVYFYFVDGRWLEAPKPPTYFIKNSVYVKIKTDSRKPYLKHPKHKKKHPPGQLKKEKLPPQKVAPLPTKPKKPKPDKDIEKGKDEEKEKGKGKGRGKRKGKKF